MRAALPAALVLASAAAWANAPVARAQPQPTGAIRGQVRFAGATPQVARLTVEDDQDFCGATMTNSWLRVSPTGGVADVVVYLADFNAGHASPVNQTVASDHVHCEITPRIRIVQPGTTLVLRNSDPIFHSTRLRVLGTKLFPFGSGLPPAGTPYETPAQRLYQPGFYQLECTDGHPLERGYLIVAAHPYYALTAADGTFELDRVPPGRYTTVAWHPGWTFAIDPINGLGQFAAQKSSVSVTVIAGQTATVALTLGAH